jgi:hypothetical protein
MFQERHVDSCANGILFIGIEYDFAAIIALLQCSQDIFSIVTPVAVAGYMASPRSGVAGRQRPEWVMRLARIGS